ncbi:hypothetical protein C361_01936 [Cryptococcus neoformans Tu259-1]|uniref:Uncharacterized protein n=1 Tax=Cryptococcus neoformans Tu259-1 TaxID=1230072 RepID=A0A854QDK5_CRYNE|nr:hypothetical protein C361_01936 [Cryptococcus neoformans var. grubii Tu259-1]OXG36854.1 hypothetical protein C360_01977 [Cryptococcus neoformans var. grubii Bt15]
MDSATHVPPPNTTRESRLAAVGKIQTRGWRGGFVQWEMNSPPSRFVFLQRIETNVEEASTQFIHLAPPLFPISRKCVPWPP